jgi:hypothetical protein
MMHNYTTSALAMHGPAAEARLKSPAVPRKSSRRLENPGTDDHSTAGSLEDIAASLHNAGHRARRRMHTEEDHPP